MVFGYKGPSIDDAISRVCVCTPSCPTLCDPIGCSPPGSSVHGILQAGRLEWVARPSSRGSFWPRDQTCVSCVSCIGRWILYHWATWEAISRTSSTYKAMAFTIQRIISNRGSTSSLLVKWCQQTGVIRFPIIWSEDLRDNLGHQINLQFHHQESFLKGFFFKLCLFFHPSLMLFFFFKKIFGR